MSRILRVTLTSNANYLRMSAMGDYDQKRTFGYTYRMHLYNNYATIVHACVNEFVCVHDSGVQHACDVCPWWTRRVCSMIWS